VGWRVYGGLQRGYARPAERATGAVYRSLSVVQDGHERSAGGPRRDSVSVHSRFRSATRLGGRVSAARTAYAVLLWRARYSPKSGGVGAGAEPATPWHIRAALQDAVATVERERSA